MTSVGIVGAGFWGGAVQKVLGRHFDVSVVDPGDHRAASGAAQGLVKLDWLRSATLASVIPAWWGRAHDEASEALLVALGARETVELVTAWNKPEATHRGGLLLVDPHEARAKVDFRARVLRVEQWDHHVAVKLEDDDTLVFDRVVLATGVWTDRLLEASGYPKLGITEMAGSTVICEGEGPRDVVWTHVTSPYKHITVRPWKERLSQLGATVAKGPDDQSAFEAMMGRVRKQWPQLDPTVRLQGWRPVGPEGRAVVDKVAPGIVVATGGARIGLALAGGIARRVEDLLQ